VRLIDRHDGEANGSQLCAVVTDDDLGGAGDDDDRFLR
jgi:hypothetical protein